MLTFLKRLYAKEMFEPSWLGVLINPFYITRRNLHKAILDNSHYLKGRLLDLGCGSKPYEEFFQCDEYLGLEIDGGYYDKEGAVADKFYDGKTIPFDDETFDAVFSSEVFEHIFNLEEIIEELNRVSKPGAHALVTLPFAWPEHEQPYDFARYSSFGIKHLFEKYGFEIVSHTKTGCYISTLSQLFTAYIFDFLMKCNPYIRLLGTLFLISPVTIVSILAAAVLPGNDTYYLDNVIVARKVH